MVKNIKKFLDTISAWARYNPPGALTTEAWHLFDLEFKEKAPVRYFFHKQLPRTYRPFIRKFDKAVWWLRYRTFDKYHIVKTELTPGYYEIETLMLHSNFNMLKDYVEIQLASIQYLFSEDREKNNWKEKFIPFYNFFRKYDQSYGIKALEFKMSLADPSLPPHARDDNEAAFGKEVYELYNWWVNVRPNRHLQKIPLPEYSDQNLGSMSIFHPAFDRNADDYVAFKDAYDTNGNMQNFWDTEDDIMLERLIKIRRRLWT